MNSHTVVSYCQRGIELVVLHFLGKEQPAESSTNQLQPLVTSSVPAAAELPTCLSYQTQLERLLRYEQITRIILTSEGKPLGVDPSVSDLGNKKKKRNRDSR